MSETVEKFVDVKVKRDGDQVTLVMPEQLARFVKRGVEFIGIALATDDVFHETSAESVASSTMSINLVNLFEALTRVGVK